MDYELTPIELELKKRCEKDGLDYYVICEKMFNYLQQDRYPYIRAQNPWYNDHGIDHTKAVLNTISVMVGRYLIAIKELRNETSELPLQKLYLSTEDIFILISACMWHDVAMIEMRKGHGSFLINFAGKINEFIQNKDLTNCVMDVAISHSEKDRFHKCIPYMRVSCNTKLSGNKNVQVKLLAAILRFADEISEDKERTTSEEDILKKIIDTEHEIYWRHTLSINYSKYEYEQRRVGIDYEIDEKYALKQYKTSESSDKTQSLIEFIVNRIKKVNDERILCAPFFSCYCPVDSICINLRFYKSSENGFREAYIHQILDVLVSSYPHSESGVQLSDFMTAYPSFDIGKIEEDVIRNRGRIS